MWQGKGQQSWGVDLSAVLSLMKGLGMKGKGKDVFKGKGKGSPMSSKGLLLPGKGFAGGKGFAQSKGSENMSPAERKADTSKIAVKLQMGESLFQGRVRSFSHIKKRGYIYSPEVMAISGQEVYVYQDVLTQANAGVGDQVIFFVHWSIRGQPQASSPMLRISGGEKGMALKGTFKPAKSEDKQFGFIDCPEIKEYFGRDVYVNKDIAVTLIPGSTVSFNVFLNREGFPSAQAATPCEEDWTPAPPDLSWSHELENPANPQSAIIDLKDRSLGMGLESTPGAKTATGQIFTGLVKSFNVATNYGFLECQEVKDLYGFDVFLHGNSVVHPIEVGDAVNFELAINKRGQPQANNCVKVGAEGLGEPAAKKPRILPAGATKAPDAFDRMVAELTA